MQTIYKYPFIIEDTLMMNLPEGALIVLVANQDQPMNEATLWALVDTGAKNTYRRLYVRGTGHPLPDGVRHLFSWTEGSFVWHLFEDDVTS